MKSVTAFARIYLSTECRFYIPRLTA